MYIYALCMYDCYIVSAALESPGEKRVRSAVPGHKEEAALAYSTSGGADSFLPFSLRLSVSMPTRIALPCPPEQLYAYAFCIIKYTLTT